MKHGKRILSSLIALMIVGALTLSFPVPLQAADREAHYSVGDIDLSGAVTADDLTALARRVAMICSAPREGHLCSADGATYYDLCDVNTDGAVSADDLTALARHVGGIELLSSDAYAVSGTGEDPLVLPDISDVNGQLWYRFNENVGATVLKTSLSTARDSIAFSGVMLPTGGPDGSGCVEFNGSNDGIKLNNTFTQMSQVTDGTFLHPATRQISVAFSFMPYRLNGQQILFEYGSQYRGFAVGLDGNKLVAAFSAAKDADSDGTRKLLASYELPADAVNRWIHVLLTYDGTMDGGTATLYVDLIRASQSREVGGYLAKVMDASGVATAAHGSNALLWSSASFAGRMDDLRIYKSCLTPIPELEESALFLQSAAKKNYYLRASEEYVSCACMVEPGLRGIVIEPGLSDSNGVSLRMTGTRHYLTAIEDGVTAKTVIGTADRAAATFYADSALAVPSWGQSDSDLFVSFRTADGRYLTADNGDVRLTLPSTQAQKLNASFCKTGDQTAVPENFRGAVYYPGYALNAPQFWKWYDSAVIEQDMQGAKKLNINAFRIWVSYEYWLENPEHFEASYNDFLTLADKYDIKVLVSLFDGCGKDSEGYYSANVWSRDYTVAWCITSPGKEIYNNSSRWNEPKAFVSWFFEKYGNDDRHMGIEIYNEPWGARGSCAEYLTKFALTVQGSVPITMGSIAGVYTIPYLVENGADILQYHDNFPMWDSGFRSQALTRIEEGRLANLPVYCTEVQWVGGPANINYPSYANLAPTCEELTGSGVWAPFYWTLIVHPCYLPDYRNTNHMFNGILQEDGSFYSLANAAAIAPEADLSGETENPHNPYDDGAYRYRHLFSDDFSDKHGYKWTVSTGSWSVAEGDGRGNGVYIANDTAFDDFTAEVTVTVGAAESGVLFRASDEGNGYLAMVSGTTLTLYRVSNGQRTLLGQKAITAVGDTVLTVSADGPSLSARVGSVTCSVTDSTYTTGAVGLCADSEAVFDDFLVRADS